METVAAQQKMTQAWLDEGRSTGAAKSPKPGRYLWNWSLQVQVGDRIEYGQAQAIWDGGIEFAIKRELLVGSHVGIRRQLGDVQPWVDVCIEAAVGDKDGTVIVDGTFHA